MAKIKLTSYIPMSHERTGDSLFYGYNEAEYTRYYLFPINYTNHRKIFRELYINAYKAWRNLPSCQKRIYFRRVEKLNYCISAPRLFMSEYIKEHRKYKLEMN